MKPHGGMDVYKIYLRIECLILSVYWSINVRWRVTNCVNLRSEAKFLVNPSLSSRCTEIDLPINISLRSVQVKGSAIFVLVGFKLSECSYLSEAAFSIVRGKPVQFTRDIGQNRHSCQLTPHSRVTPPTERHHPPQEPPTKMFTPMTHKLPNNAKQACLQYIKSSSNVWKYQKSYNKQTSYSFHFIVEYMIGGNALNVCTLFLILKVDQTRLRTTTCQFAEWNRPQV